MHVTHCNGYINYLLGKCKLGSSTALGVAKTNQAGLFFSFRVKSTLKPFYIRKTA